jgi:hypothetical protein
LNSPKRNIYYGRMYKGILISNAKLKWRGVAVNRKYPTRTKPTETALPVQTHLSFSSVLITPSSILFYSISPFCLFHSQSYLLITLSRPDYLFLSLFILRPSPTQPLKLNSRVWLLVGPRLLGALSQSHIRAISLYFISIFFPSSFYFIFSVSLYFYARCEHAGRNTWTEEIDWKA